MEKEVKLSNYEEFILAIFHNATCKIMSAGELYLNKLSYNEAYFLAVIAQEELAKLIILPIAKELGEIDALVNDRTSSYYRHPVKQKIFTNFGLQNRTHTDIEKIKQSCLYVGIDKDHKPVVNVVKPDIVLAEIKHAALFLAHNYRTILLEKSFSEKFRKMVGFFMNIAYNFVKDKLPEVNVEIDKDAKRDSERTPDELERELHKTLFTNPYELIKIFKAAFKEDYKKHLKQVGFFTIEELEDYFEKIESKS